MKTVLFILIVSLGINFLPGDELKGRWQTPVSPKGNTTGIVFKEGNMFEGYINKKPFVTGVYTYEDSVFSFVDNGCNGIRGTYKIIFFSQGDSMRFEPIVDSCEERKRGMSISIFGKVK